MQYRAARDSAFALAIVDGVVDERDVPRYANIMLAMPGAAKNDEPAAKHYLQVEQKHRDWMKKKGID